MVAEFQKTDSRSTKTCDRIVDAATDLFNQNGFYATGINLIIAQSNITKSTFYRYFLSKDDLVIAVLKKIDLEFIEEMKAYVTQNSTTNEDQILMTFDYLKSWFEQDDFFGCPFISAANEFCNKNDKILVECMGHKIRMIDYFESLLLQTGSQNPREMAEAVYFLHEGATADSFVNRRSEAALKTKSIVKQLLGNC